MNLLIYDMENMNDKLKNYLGNFKNLVLVHQDDNDTFRKYWSETKNILDATKTHKFYKKAKSTDNQEEKLFKKDVNFVILKNRKVVKLEDLSTFLYKKENFSEEDYKEILKKKHLIQDVLTEICKTFKNNLEKDLEDILKDKVLNISSITPDNSKIFLVKDTNINTEENVIDLNDYELLKELKDILVYKI